MLGGRRDLHEPVSPDQRLNAIPTAVPNATNTPIMTQDERRFARDIGAAIPSGV
jgi:hypothetical protein